MPLKSRSRAVRAPARAGARDDPVPSGHDPDGRPPLVLVARGLSKVFGEGDIATTAVADCDVEVRAGEILAIVGPSGSGKSTLLHLLSGLDTPTSGQVLLEGVDLHSLGDRKLAGLRSRRIGFVLQRFNLIPSLTVRENVAAPMMLSGVPRDKALARADEMLHRVGIGHRGAAFPAQISGGEAQRAAVARACSNNPALIFADEPTGALDLAAGDRVMDLFGELVRDLRASAIIVTHEPRLAARADARLELCDGRPRA